MGFLGSETGLSVVGEIKVVVLVEVVCRARVVSGSNILINAVVTSGSKLKDPKVGVLFIEMDFGFS